MTPLTKKEEMKVFNTLCRSDGKLMDAWREGKEQDHKLNIGDSLDTVEMEMLIEEALGLPELHDKWARHVYWQDITLPKLFEAIAVMRALP